MAWLDGESFLSYVERNLHAPARLLDLAQQWVEMAQTIGQAGIAHGDLQHGNILVVNGRLRLIDYDGMYVPALDGRAATRSAIATTSTRRTEDAFGRRPTTFRRGLSTVRWWRSADPALWQVLNGGDECLLFRHEDFLRPERSAACALEQSPDARLTRLADVLRTLLPWRRNRSLAIDGQLTVRPTRAAAGRLGAGSFAFGRGGGHGRASCCAGGSDAICNAIATVDRGLHRRRAAHRSARSCRFGCPRACCGRPLDDLRYRRVDSARHRCGGTGRAGVADRRTRCGQPGLPGRSLPAQTRRAAAGRGARAWPMSSAG